MSLQASGSTSQLLRRSGATEPTLSDREAERRAASIGQVRHSRSPAGLVVLDYPSGHRARQVSFIGTMWSERAIGPSGSIPSIIANKYLKSSAGLRGRSAIIAVPVRTVSLGYQVHIVHGAAVTHLCLAPPHPHPLSLTLVRQVRSSFRDAIGEDAEDLRAFQLLPKQLQGTSSCTRLRPIFIVFSQTSHAVGINR